MKLSVDCQMELSADLIWICGNRTKDVAAHLTPSQLDGIKTLITHLILGVFWGEKIKKKSDILKSLYYGGECWGLYQSPQVTAGTTVASTTGPAVACGTL